MAGKKKNIELIAYSTDASMIEGRARAVVFPKSAEEISRIIKSGNNFVVRGGGTGLVGGAVPNNEVVIDLSKMNKIINIDMSKKTAEVESGIILDELNNYLDNEGLEFPVKPSSHEVCTIGGMISTNAVGNRAMKYGRTNEWVEEIEIVSGKGEIMSIKKTNLQDFAGMEGITGVIVKAKLKLIEKRQKTASLFSLDSIEETINSVMKLKMMNDVCSIEFLDKMVSSFLGMQNKYHLIAEFESEQGKLKGEDYVSIMELRDRVYPSLAKLGYTRIEDPKILIHKFQELAEFLESGKVPFFGHIGSGIIHPVFMEGEDDRVKVMLKYVKSIHGNITGEHGIGIRKKEFLEPMERNLIERVKKRYDPLCKINCGKVIDLNEKKEEKNEKLEKIEEAIRQENQANELGDENDN